MRTTMKGLQEMVEFMRRATGRRFKLECYNTPSLYRLAEYINEETGAIRVIFRYEKPGILMGMLSAYMQGYQDGKGKGN